MENIFNYLKNVFQDLKSETKQNPLFLPLILVLISIPLGYAIGGIAVGLFVFISLITFKKSSFSIDKNLVFPMILYLLMLVSLVWSYDINATFKALSKTLPLFVIPFCFMISPKFTNQQKQKIVSYYSHTMLLFTLYYLARAGIRFVISYNPEVFFYHELVTNDLNAIHVSVYMTVACFYFITKKSKLLIDKIAISILALFIILLSSKNIIIVFFFLIIIYYWRYYKETSKIKGLSTIIFVLILIAIVFTGKIKDRFSIEYLSNTVENSVNQEISNPKGKVYNVSIKQAWTQDNFKPNDYFSGTAFRVYQIRIFVEMLQEDPLIVLTGYGLDATNFRIAEKGIEHTIYLGDATHEGYQKMNFHNQYIQFFAELGIFGLLFLIIMLFASLKYVIKSNDFVSISFVVLMISLFLTESFLSRQRGVIFFITLYSLFNLQTIPKEQKK
jgi:O-antigen ligase